MWLDFLSSFTEQFLNAVIPVLAASLAGLVIALFTKVINDIKEKLTDQQEWIITQAVNAAVLAAEQVHFVDAAIDKKDYAIDIATEWLKSKGIKIDLARLDALIEAAVMNEFNRSRVSGA